MSILRRRGRPRVVLSGEKSLRIAGSKGKFHRCCRTGRIRNPLTINNVLEVQDEDGEKLLLGTAAGLVAMTGAQAADLPVKAKPVQYVKICSLYGAGFYYIPGYRPRASRSAASFAPSTTSTRAVRSTRSRSINYTRESAENTIRVRSVISVDARAQTEYGTLRSYIQSGWQRTNQTDTLYIPRGFVQLGGFTAGIATSFYDFYSTPAYSNTTNVWGADTGGNGDTVAAYTAQLGNGLSATISVEDPVTRRAASTPTPLDGLLLLAALTPVPPSMVRRLVRSFRISSATSTSPRLGAARRLWARCIRLTRAYYTAGLSGARAIRAMPMVGQSARA